MGKSAKVIGVGANPDSRVWTPAEVVVFESLAGLGVSDGVGFGAVGAGADRITSVQSRFSHGVDEMWRIHPQIWCWGLRSSGGVQAR